MNPDLRELLGAFGLCAAMVAIGLTGNQLANAPDPATPARIYHLRKVSPQPGTPRAAVVRAFGERDARSRAVEACGEWCWRDEAAVSCVVLSDLGPPGAICVSHST